MKIWITCLLAILVIFVASCQSEDQVEFNRYYSGGAAIYKQHCQNCHGARGEGLNNLIPPLTDQQYLIKNKVQLACAIRNGLNGKIVVSGRVFDGVMPAEELSPIEIAKVLTYVTNSFGNRSGTVNNEMVTADLKNCK